MALTEYALRPYPIFAKLAVMLRTLPAAQFLFAKVLRNDKTFGEPLISNFLDEAPGASRSTLDQPVATLKSAGEIAIPEPTSSDQSEREKLIRRRWVETGIKMWNLDFHGVGHAALNIQGRSELLPVKPGETLRGYDKLEFKMVRSYINGRTVNHIVCEGVVVDPPKRRTRHLTAAIAMTIIGT
jgi:hypothetical protein